MADGHAIASRMSAALVFSPQIVQLIYKELTIGCTCLKT